MKFTCCALFVFTLLSGASAGAEALQVNPLQKVVQLLSDMEAKIKTNGEKEDNTYAEYSSWCTSDAREKGFDIKTAAAEIEDLSATINKAATDASGASSKKEGLAASIATGEGDLKAATEIRKKERSDFAAVESELMDTIDTLDRAINTLERKGSALLQTKVSGKDVPHLVQALSVVLNAASVSTRDKNKLVALAQSSAADDDDALNAPAPEAYKSHSGSILDVLEDLREKAITQLDESRKQEVNSSHNFEMLKQLLEDQIEADAKEMGEAKGSAVAAIGVRAAAEQDLHETQKGLSATQNALKELNGACTTAAADHEASTKSRGEELAALAAAKAAIQEMTGGAEAVAYSSFLEMGLQVEHEAALADLEVVTLLRQLAKKTDSVALGQLANHIRAVMRVNVASGNDRFAKVKGLITDLLKKLQDEAGADATHKAFCDKETAATQEKIDSLSRGVDKLTAEVDKKRALSETLKGEAAELSRELADLAKSQAEMNKVRLEEHAVFIQTKADLEQGLEGVRLAIKILRDHYGSSLLQQPGAPTSHEKSVGAVTGVIGTLEVIESDLGKNLAECESQEDSAASEHQKITQSNKVTKTTKDQGVKYKTSEAASLDKSIAELTTDRQSTQTELDAVFEYKKSIEAACIVKPEIYEGRRSRREAELAGLREALQILEGQAGFLQKNGLRGALVRRHD